MLPWRPLLLAALALAPRQEPAAAPADQLILTRGLDADPAAKEVRETFERFRPRVRELADPVAAAGGAARELRQEVRAIDTSIADTRSRAAMHLGLALHRATRAAHASSGFAFDYQPTLGVLRLVGFDERRGIEAGVSVKLENDRALGAEAEEAEEEAEAILAKLLDSLVAAYRAEQQAADAAAGVPYQETIRWEGDEDPPDLGFRWSYVREGAEARARVTFVVANGSLAQAGLRRGDVVVAVHGTEVASAPAFGRAIAGLAAGAPLALAVRRGAERVALEGVVHRSSELLPAFEQSLVGRALPAFRAEVGAPPVDVGGSDATPRPAATIVLVFDPRQSDTLADVATLEWIRERYPAGQVAIAGIGAHASAEALRGTMDELKLGWPAAPDPDGRLAEATCSPSLPALLVADRDGIVRFRRARGGGLQHALRGLLAAPPR